MGGAMELSPYITEIEKSMESRTEKINGTKTKLNNVEDKIFGNFCKAIGVKNIREYEEQGLKNHQDKENKILEFDTQINRILHQLEYEKKRDEQLSSNVEKYERILKDD